MSLEERRSSDAKRLFLFLIDSSHFVVFKYIGLRNFLMENGVYFILFFCKIVC